MPWPFDAIFRSTFPGSPTGEDKKSIKKEETKKGKLFWSKENDETNIFFWWQHDRDLIFKISKETKMTVEEDFNFFFLNKKLNKQKKKKAFFSSSSFKSRGNFLFCSLALNQKKKKTKKIKWETVTRQSGNLFFTFFCFFFSPGSFIW